jgi:hypothetical protein
MLMEKNDGRPSEKTRILMKITLLASLLTIGLGTTFATTTDELELIVGSQTAIISDNGSCSGTGCGSLTGDINSAAGTTTVTGSIGNWTISITSGTSNSPNDDPFGLDLTSLTAACSGGPCDTNPLDVLYSDKNFSPANPSFITGYSTTISGSGNGSTSESAYFSNSNNLFQETTLIGTVGPFTSSNGGTATGGTGSVAPYSLTLAQVFTHGSGTNPISFSSDGSVSSTVVPEPAAVMLLGTVLVLCASKLRRRRNS